MTLTILYFLMSEQYWAHSIQYIHHHLSLEEFLTTSEFKTKLSLHVFRG